MPERYEKRSCTASGFSAFVVDGRRDAGQRLAMFDTGGLLSALRARGITNAEIARALSLPSSRIAEMFAGKRQIKLDEAKRLVDAFRLLEPAEEPQSLSVEAARLVVRHIAQRVGRPLSGDDALLQELAEDLSAFARFALRLDQAPSLEAATGFLAGRLSGSQSRH